MAETLKFELHIICMFHELLIRPPPNHLKMVNTLLNLQAIQEWVVCQIWPMDGFASFCYRLRETPSQSPHFTEGKLESLRRVRGC